MHRSPESWRWALDPGDPDYEDAPERDPDDFDPPIDCPSDWSWDGPY